MAHGQKALGKAIGREVPCGLGRHQETVSVSGSAAMMLWGLGSFVFCHSVYPHTAWDALKALGLAP